MLLSKILAELLLPPANLLILGGISAWVARRQRRLGVALGVLAFALLYLLSTPIVANWLLRSLEPEQAVARSPTVRAIVVLGGGAKAPTPEYGDETVNTFTLERLRYAARLQRATQLPILVTGGVVARGQRRSEGELMAQTLQEDFGVATRWIESRAHTTEQNAVLSAALLAPLGIKNVYLVSHAWHMPRALAAFRAAGLVPVAAPTGFTTAFEADIREYIPDAKALLKSYYAMHEWIGLVWYRIKPPFRAARTSWTITNGNDDHLA